MQGSFRVGLPFLSVFTDFLLPEQWDWVSFLFHQEVIFLPKAEISYYTSLSRFTLALHGRGWLGTAFGPSNRKSTLLQQDLLAIGGDRSVRGYLRDRIGVPQLATQAQNGIDTTRGGWLVLGGGFVNAEVRYTLVRDLFIGDLKIAGFVDAGMVTSNSPTEEGWVESHFNVDQPRFGASVGAGIRYVLPVGPLSLDFGVPVVGLADTDAPWNIHFQLGYAF